MRPRKLIIDMSHVISRSANTIFQVYCKRCFDHRRPTSKSNIQVGFRQGELPSKKLLCAVEDCDSEVGTKTAWVGIFM